MCLGELAQVVEVGPAASAVVRSSQRTMTVSLMTLDAGDAGDAADAGDAGDAGRAPVAPGDWLLCHSGFALARLSPQAAAEAAGIRATGRTHQTQPPRKDDP